MTVPGSSGGSGRFTEFLQQCRAIVAHADPLEVRGRLTRSAGLVMEVVGLKLPVGARVAIVQADTARLDAEVVGFAGERLFLMPISEPQGIRPGATAVPFEAAAARPRLGRHNHPLRRVEDRTRQVPLGEALLGRVVDPAGTPLDRGGPIRTGDGSACEMRPLVRRPINSMDRAPMRSALDVGVRAINALLTVGRGQRMGLFAGSGVGKSVLLGMMARYTSADVIVVGLIGERGREVKEFIEHILGAEGLRALGRRRRAGRRDAADAPAGRGLRDRASPSISATRASNVLLIMDSLTRYAHGRSARSRWPSASRRRPRAIRRRCSPSCRSWSSAPATAAAGRRLDHRVLHRADRRRRPAGSDRRLPRAPSSTATSCCRARWPKPAIIPAIDIEASITRVMPSVCNAAELEAARRFKPLYSRYQRNRDLIAVGAYVARRGSGAGCRDQCLPARRALPAADHDGARQPRHRAPGTRRPGAERAGRGLKPRRTRRTSTVPRRHRRNGKR